MWQKILREPVAIANAVAAVVEAILIVLLTFGVDISDEQRTAISAAIIAVGQFIATLVGRQFVTPVNDPRDNNGKRLY